jgi:hypothetical protein
VDQARGGSGSPTTHQSESSGLHSCSLHPHSTPCSHPRWDLTNPIPISRPSVDSNHTVITPTYILGRAQGHQSAQRCHMRPGVWVACLWAWVHVGLWGGMTVAAEGAPHVLLFSEPRKVSQNFYSRGCSSFFSGVHRPHTLSADRSTLSIHACDCSHFHYGWWRWSNMDGGGRPQILCGLLREGRTGAHTARNFPSLTPRYVHMVNAELNGQRSPLTRTVALMSPCSTRSGRQAPQSRMTTQRSSSRTLA